MKSLASLVAVIAAAPLVASTSIIGAREDCDLVEGSAICPSCDGQNTTDAVGDKWAISCDWVVDAESEQAVQGVVSFRNCLNACDDAEDCFAVNFASNGSCVIVGGQQQALRSSASFTNLARLATSTSSPAKSTSQVSITRTLIPPELTWTSTSGSPTATPPGTTGSCDLSDADLCPNCNGLVAIDSNDKAYRVLCDTSIDSNGSYSVQEWMSPAECLEQCDELDFCTGATYYDERSCEIAKANPSARYDESNTAFFPIFTASPATTKRSTTSSRIQAWNATITTPTAGPTASILPINPGCNPSAVTCPECDGMPIIDKLNGSYTVICDIEPTCESKSTYRDPDNQDLCLESCDHGATCLAAMWYPDTKACNLCLQGIKSAVTKEDLPYVLLLADTDGDDDEGDATLSPRPTNTTSSRRISSTATLTSSLSRSITALPSPFPSSKATSTIGTVGIVSVASVSSASKSTTPARPTSSHVASIANLTCPADDDSIYFNGNGDYFAVTCDSRLNAAHSRFLSASNFAACVASCTGSCDGVQFGASTRCGLYTSISVVGPATGWTVAASVTFPSVTGLPAAITTVGALSSALAVVSSTTSTTFSRTNGTVSWSSPSVTAASSPIAYTAPAYNPL